MDYKNAGVDIEAGYKSVELMKKHIQQTMRPEVLTNIGGFSGAFSMEKFKDMEKPTLVSGTDGVGTKLKLAFKEVYGVSITEYIQQRRLSHAETLLSLTDFTIEQVAAAVGYNNAGRFASMFKKSTGVYPAEYRKMAQK